MIVAGSLVGVAVSPTVPDAVFDAIKSGGTLSYIDRNLVDHKLGAASANIISAGTWLSTPCSTSEPCWRGARAIAHRPYRRQVGLVAGLQCHLEIYWRQGRSRQRSSTGHELAAAACAAARGARGRPDSFLLRLRARRKDPRDGAASRWSTCVGVYSMHTVCVLWRWRAALSVSRFGNMAHRVSQQSTRSRPVRFSSRSAHATPVDVGAPEPRRCTTGMGG